jgi:hypothetical protein
MTAWSLDTVTIQGFVLAGVEQFDQPPNDEVPVGVAVSVTTVLAGNNAAHTPAELAQLRPDGLLLTVPAPSPPKVKVRAKPPPPPPVPVKQITFAVMYPVTTAPDEFKPPSLVFVFAVAETRVPPQASPVAVSMPVELTVNIWTVFDSQVT